MLPHRPVLLCRECGLAQLLDVIAPEVLYGDYIYMTSSSLGLAERFSGMPTTCCLPPVRPPRRSWLTLAATTGPS